MITYVVPNRKLEPSDKKAWIQFALEFVRCYNFEKLCEATLEEFEAYRVALEKQKILFIGGTRERLFRKTFRKALLEKNTSHPNGGLMPMGAFSYSNGYIGGLSRVGRYCSLANNIRVMGNNHPTDWISTSPWQYSQNIQTVQDSEDDVLFAPHNFRSRPHPVSIGDDVWIGQDVTLKGGIHIGSGSIIAAGSVVTKDVQDFSIVGGVPAKKIRSRFDVRLRQRILALQWWNYDFRKFDGLSPSKPEEFMAGLESLVAEKRISEMPEVRKTAENWCGI